MIGFFRINSAKANLLKKRRAEAPRDSTTGMITDPIESDPLYAGLLKHAEGKTQEILKSVVKGRGFCHREWQTKQEILLKEYGVIWFSPPDMNPGHKFD